jgi:hypothetical protein
MAFGDRIELPIQTMPQKYNLCCKIGRVCSGRKKIIEDSSLK